MPALNVTIADPTDVAVIARLARECDQAVHLIGTIREGRGSRYADAHERPAQALAEATGSCKFKSIVTLSILGAHQTSDSMCLRSRAAAEDILCSSSAPVTVIRVPMVLGESDRASFALARRAASRRVTLLRANSLEQPIYAGDVICALRNTLDQPLSSNTVFDLAGPESLTRRDLVIRAAASLNLTPTIHSLPLTFGLALAWFAGCTSARPRITREMLRVLDHDDDIDPTLAANALNVQLTSVDEMLRQCIPGRLRGDSITQHDA